jgi:hypothetical protein
VSGEDLTLAQRVQDAMQAHLVENEGGGFPTEFLLIANYNDCDGEPSYFLTVADDQRVSTTLGLSQWGALATEADARRHFAEDGE